MFESAAYPMRNCVCFHVAWSDHFVLNSIRPFAYVTLIQIQKEFALCGTLFVRNGDFESLVSCTLVVSGSTSRFRDKTKSTYRRVIANEEERTQKCSSYILFFSLVTFLGSSSLKHARCRVRARKPVQASVGPDNHPAARLICWL
jgi:hypothetical protein